MTAGRRPTGGSALDVVVDSHESQSYTPPRLLGSAKVNHSIPTNSGHSVQSTSAVVHSDASALAHALITTIKSAQPIRSQHYFVSNFDPTINNIDAWCDEVDRARDANGWSDHECLSRVASCLKGDARIWLTEWVTNDRTWSNFKKEFKPLCPSRLDFANILFDAMKTTSDSYRTYAEYARRTLLRLRVVQGLSEELRTLIVIKGIDSPQVRAAAANASLTPDNLVSFLSIYVKPNRTKNDARPQAAKVATNNQFLQNSAICSESKCYNCNQRGHISRDCPKKYKPLFGPAPPSNSNNQLVIVCSFCKKPGHNESTCFAKARSEPHNQRNVNLCSERSHPNSDVTNVV